MSIISVLSRINNYGAKVINIQKIFAPIAVKKRIKTAQIIFNLRHLRAKSIQFHK